MDQPHDGQPRLLHTPNRLSWSLDVITINHVRHLESWQMTARILRVLQIGHTWLVYYLPTSVDALDQLN